MSDASKQLAGILFVLVPTVELGGWSLLRMIARRVPGYLDNPVLRGRDPVFRTRPATWPPSETCSGPATPTPACCCC